MRHPGAPGRVPRHALEGFQRINLAPGARQTVPFLLSPRQLSRLDARAQRVEAAGKVEVYVSGGQPLAAAVAAGRVQKADVVLTGSSVVID